MSQFDSAIALVHESLCQLCKRKEIHAPRASVEALQRLAAVAAPAARAEGNHAPGTTTRMPRTTRPAPQARESAPFASQTSAAPAPQSAPVGERKFGLAAMAKAALSGAPAPAPLAQPSPAAAERLAASAAPSTPTAPTTPSAPPLSTAAPTLPKQERMEKLQQQAVQCTRCAQLVDGRSQVVFGSGNLNAELVFVTSAPGAEEDATGTPLAGKAGQLFEKIVEAMGFKLSQVYLTPVIKCQTEVLPDAPPPGNRAPSAEELVNCLPFLSGQIEIIQPKCIVTLGQPALEGLLGEAFTYGLPRGKWQGFHGIPVMPTYHPSHLIENQSLSEKRKLWEDMLQVLELLGRPVTPKQRGFFLPRPGAEG